MKITRIETIPIRVPLKPEFAIRSGRGGAHTVSPFLLVKVHTDEGIVGLGEASRLEIDSRRKSEVRVARAGVAEGAAMFASPIRIDRAIEADVGRVVAGNDFPRGIERNGGLERRQFVERPPAVVERDPRLGLEPAAGVGLSAATAPAFALD